MTVTSSRIIEAWYGLTDRWFTRVNKDHTDGLVFEVVHDWGIDVIDDRTMKVIGRFASQEEASSFSDSCEDYARADAVRELFLANL